MEPGTPDTPVPHIPFNFLGIACWVSCYLKRGNASNFDLSLGIFLELVIEPTISQLLDLFSSVMSLEDDYTEKIHGYD